MHQNLIATIIGGIIPLPFFPIMILFYLLIYVAIFYFIYKWVNQFIDLKKEQNYLLREIIKKMEK